MLTVGDRDTPSPAGCLQIDLSVCGELWEAGI